MEENRVRIFIFHYLRTRMPETFLMMGFPFAGVLFSLSVWSLSTLRRLIIFCFATFLLGIHIYIFNDWGTFSSERDRFAVDIPKRGLLFCSFALLGVSLPTYFLLSYRTFFIAAILSFTWMPYAHPGILIKGKPVLPTMEHFLAGILMFLLGYSLFKQPDLEGFAVSGYFALIFSAGHLNHEAKDYEEDNHQNLPSGQSPPLNSLLYTK